MRASRLLKLPVMAMREGLEQGQVVDIVVDPEKKKVSHYIVRKGSRYDLLLVAATDIRGIGTGYLVVPDSTVVRRIFGDARRMEVVSRGFYLTDAQVISDAGIALGGIVDYDFDPRTCLVSALILENGAQYSASQIVGLSGTTVFVSGSPTKGSIAPRTPAPAASAQAGTQSMPQPVAAERLEVESTVITPAPAQGQTVSRAPSTPGFTRPGPSVSAQVRNAYRSESPAAERRQERSVPERMAPERVAPERVVPERRPEPYVAERREDREFSNDTQMVKPPNVLRRLLVGKRLADSVASADGIFSLPAGTVITEWHMQLAEQHDAVQQLMKHVEPS